MSLDQIKKLEDDIHAKRVKLHELKKQEFSIEEVNNYNFSLPGGETVSLLELFGEKEDLIVIHNMGKSCSYCTLWADGFNGQYEHLNDRTSFVIASPDDPDVQRDFADSRGWKFKIVSTANNTFTDDMGMTSEDWGSWPGMSVFRRHGNKISRVSRDIFGPGDDYCSLWHMFDLLADGANEWQPKYKY